MQLRNEKLETIASGPGNNIIYSEPDLATIVPNIICHSSIPTLFYPSSHREKKFESLMIILKTN